MWLFLKHTNNDLYLNLSDRIDDIEDELDRLSISNRLAYDDKFHASILHDTRVIVKEIMSNSKLDDSEKKELIERARLVYENCEILQK